MTQTFRAIFGEKKALIACIHLEPLPGAPRYGGSMASVIDRALAEAAIFQRNGVSGLIVENFRDRPFFPGQVPAETVAAMAVLCREIRRTTALPIGVNVLRNDAHAALAVAVAADAQFIRVNVHTGVVVSEQGIIEGQAHATLRLREMLRTNPIILADVGVKHAVPLAERGLATEAFDAGERGFADGLIVSGEATGREVEAADVDVVRRSSPLPVIIGSGMTPENLDRYFPRVDGFIVGTAFKLGGKSEAGVDEERVKRFVERFRKLAGGGAS